MQKLKAFFDNKSLYALWAAALCALLGYAAYSFHYEFLAWRDLPLVGLYAAVCGIAFALLFLLYWRAKEKKRPVPAFVGALAFYEVVLWTLLTVINVDGKFNRRAIHIAYAVLFTVCAALLFMLFFTLGKKRRPVINRVLAAVFCLAFLFAAALPVLPDKQEVYAMVNYTSDIGFAPITAENAAVNDMERETAHLWFMDHVLFTGEGVPAYDFLLDGEAFSAHTADWRYDVTGPVKDARTGGETYTVTAEHETNGLTLTVEGTFYEANATFEWTVYLQNDGAGDSPVVSGFRPLTALWDLPLEKADLYLSGGSHNAADDFTLYRAKNAAKAHVFSGTAGRSSDEYMPYFNICGGNAGAVVGIGWTGQWQATVACGNETRLDVCQQTLEAYLTPGERIRTPLVSLTMYAGGNPVKGFNSFRRWILDAVYPENTPYVLNDLDVLFVSHTRTAEQIKADVAAYPDKLYEHVDNFWMDAGWYAGCVDGWGDGNGNWTTTAERFPHGILEIARLAEEKGMGLVLWYEPERLVHGSALYEAGLKNPQYMIDPDPGNEHNNNILWNLADDGACRYLTDYIAKTLQDNGVTIYRQDFNIEPLEYWRRADKDYYGGRSGICENHYVTNLYAYLDGLFEAVPGLMMDNCASGGRRLDLEMAHRSIPLWRSDYNCEVHPDSTEATQSHTYGLSFWLPVNGVNIDLSTEYGARSSIFCGNVFTADSGESTYYGMYEAERAMLVKNFYPISFGGVKAAGVTAMQYGDDAAGEALIYKHEKAKSGDYDVAFSGLKEDAVYNVYDMDAPDAIQTLTGAELMAKAFHITLPDGKKAAIIKYEVQH